MNSVCICLSVFNSINTVGGQNSEFVRGYQRAFKRVVGSFIHVIVSVNFCGPFLRKLREMFV
jgi:hypothetical protein